MCELRSGVQFGVTLLILSCSNIWSIYHINIQLSPCLPADKNYASSCRHLLSFQKSLLEQSFCKNGSARFSSWISEGPIVIRMLVYMEANTASLLQAHMLTIWLSASARIWFEPEDCTGFIFKGYCTTGEMERTATQSPWLEYLPSDGALLYNAGGFLL